MYGQKTYRKRPLFHASSFSSDAGSDIHSIGLQSLASRKSGAVSRKSGGSEIVEGLRQDSKWLKPREYLLLLIEAGLALTAFVIKQRNLTAEELERVNLTSRQAGFYMIYAEGYSCLVCLVVGVLADSYFRYHTMALFNVIVHFAAICLVFMEDTIKGNQKGNPYSQLVWTVCTSTFVLIKSSDFTRLVYGLEGMTNRKRSTVHVFIFLQFWVSSYATYGGVILNVFNALFIYTRVKLSILAFVFTGISLYLFVYVLRPEESKREGTGLGCKVVGCILLATYYKIFRIKKRGKRGFFGNTEGKYDKVTISRAREISLLYILLVPTLGLVFQTMIRSDLFYSPIWNRVKNDRITQALGLAKLARGIKAISMLISYFVLWPLLTKIGLKDRATVKFLVGHILAVVTVFYIAIVMRSVEEPKFASNSGYVRILNTRTTPIHMDPQDRDFTTHDYSVGPKKSVMVAYPSPAQTLFAMTVVFNGTATNFTLFMSVAPDETTGYVVLDPPQIVRIRGPYLPLREGPPGTNIGSRPRIFFYNTARTLQGTAVKIRYFGEKKTLKRVLLQPGVMTTIALEPNTYDFRITEADVNKTFTFEEGGTYGVLIYATTTSRQMEIDVVVPPNSASYWPFLCMCTVDGFAAGISYPAMRAIIYTIAPHGLPAMAFAGTISLEGICLWIEYIGFRTWHYYMTAATMFAYAFAITLFFFLSLFVYLKFRDSYT